MSKQDNMDWLKKFQEDAQEFNESEYGKLTDNEVIRNNNIQDWNDSDEAQEVRIRAGKIGGNKNVESGHWNSLKTPEHQSKAGTISGNNHVESGHWRTVIELGAKACSDKFKAIRLEKTTTLRALMQDDIKYTRKELEALGKSAGLKNFIRTIVNDEFPELITKIKGPKKSSPSYYVKETNPTDHI